MGGGLLHSFLVSNSARMRSAHMGWVCGNILGDNGRSSKHVNIVWYLTAHVRFWYYIWCSERSLQDTFLVIFELA